MIDPTSNLEIAILIALLMVIFVVLVINFNIILEELKIFPNLSEINAVNITK